MSSDELKVTVCKLRFMVEAKAAFMSAGGGAWEHFLKMTGREMLDQFSTNGINLVFNQRNTMTSVTSGIEEIADAIEFEKETKQ